MRWKKLSHDKMQERVKNALSKNMNYRTENILGIPGTYLDQEEFYEDAPFLDDAPFLKTLIENPNHIGCHTLGESEPFFRGTQEIEKELIQLCAEQIFEGQKDSQDGYVASGGTEANIQAIWIYRNYFLREMGAAQNEIGVIYSQDAHYSMPKAANLLNLHNFVISVNDETREIMYDDFREKISLAQKNGIKYFIVVLNCSTTMFGSVDDIVSVTEVLDELQTIYKIHIDAAFGGFILPFTNPDCKMNFANEKVSSITIDGHKMLQAPYGTGIFLIRKGFIHYAMTVEASYIHGKDFTICGSRSGANAVAIWMILMSHGSDGWKIKMENLLERTSRLCHKLTQLKIPYFRNKYVNIITLKASGIPVDIAIKFHLVADNPKNPKWWKIVVMPHVRQGVLDSFINAIKAVQSEV